MILVSGAPLRGVNEHRRGGEMFKAAIGRLESDLGELLATHERARDLSEFAAYRDDPIGFIREVLHGSPWERQVEIAETVRDAPLVVVRSGQAIGKDWIAAGLALWWVYARRGLVLLTGPTERQVREVVMGEVARAFGRAKDLPGELYSMALRLGREETAGILAFTSTEASKLTGFHAPRVIVVLTEAQGVEPWAFEAALACATGAEDRVLAVGNPLQPSGRFYSISRAGSGWEAIRIAISEHPNLQEGREVIPGGPSPEFAGRIEREYGRQSGVYMARVEGEFPDQEASGLFRRSWIEAAVDRWEEWRVLHGEEEAVVAIDPARYGPDLTCLAVRRGLTISAIHTWGQVDLSESVDRIREVLEQVGVRPWAGGAGSSPGWSDAGRYSGGVATHRPARRLIEPGAGKLIVDEIGLGAGVLDRLNEMGYRCAGFNGGSSPENKDRFANLRAAAFWMLRERLEAGEVALPPDERLAEDLLATSWRPTSEGRVKIDAKDEIKSRLGRSPDRADAVVMTIGGEAGKRQRFSGGIVTR